jgi:hypothetical protein
MGDDCIGQKREGAPRPRTTTSRGEGHGEEEASPGNKSYRERGRTLPPISSRLIGP